jgi:transcriptional regulator with XRE-family HTH domain
VDGETQARSVSIVARTPTDVDQIIGKRIARRRAALGLSQTALAQQIGCSFQQVQKYETGANRIAGSRLFQIAEALGVAPGDLFPPVTWGPAPDRSRIALSQCVAALADVRPAIAHILKLAEQAR